MLCITHFKQKGQDKGNAQVCRQKESKCQPWKTPRSSAKEKPRSIDNKISAKLSASVKVKIEKQLEYDTEMDAKTKALHLYESSTNSETIKVHNGMWPILTKVSLNDAEEICSTELRPITTCYHHYWHVKSRTTSTRMACKRI